MVKLIQQHRLAAAYGFAAFTVGVAFVLGMVFPTLFARAPYLVFFAAVTLSAWYGGLGSGIAAGLLSVVGMHILLQSPDVPPAITQSEFVGAVGFLIVTVMMSLLHQQHRQTVQALRDSRDQLNIYLEEMANGITVQDRTGNLIYANYEAAKAMGYPSVEALLNTPNKDILSRFEIFDEVGDPYPVNSLPGQLALTGMRYPEAVLRYFFKAGHRELWAYVKARPVFDSKGDVKLAVNLIQDITQLKHAQQSLSSQREQLRVTLRSIGDAVAATDASGKITFLNPLATTFTGWDEIDALQKPVDQIFRLINEQTREVVPNPVDRIFKGDRKFQLMEQMLLVHKNGSERPVEVSAAPIHDEDNHVLGGVLVFRDLSERRAAEARLRARVRQQEVVAALGLRALAGVDLVEFMQVCSQQLAQTLQIEFVKVLELLPDGKSLLLRAGVGWHEGLVGHTLLDTETSSQGGYSLRTSEPVIVEDLRTETRFSGASLLLEHNVISGISVIIAGDEHPWGVLGAHTAQKRAFTKDDIHFLQGIANVLALTIERERIESAERQQRILAEALRDTAEVLSSTLDTAQVLDQILAIVERVVPHDAADIMLLEGGSVRIVRAHGYEEQLPGARIHDVRFDLATTPTLQTMTRTQQPLLINDVEAYADWIDVPDIAWMRAYIGVPLLLHGEVIGFLNLGSRAPNFFTAEQAINLQSFAAQSAVALGNARQFEAMRRQTTTDTSET